MSPSPARKHESPFPSTSNECCHRVMLTDELAHIFNEAIKVSFSLDEYFSDLSRLEGLDREKYGDYVCTSILAICEGLRTTDPYLFHKTQTQVIARKLLKAVKKENQKSKMIEKLCLRDVGYLTFRLSRKWMTERIKNMTNVGIDIWAPVLAEESIVIMSPRDVEQIRSHYIKDMLYRMLEYSGVPFSKCLISDKSNESYDAVRKYCTKVGIPSIHDTDVFIDDLQALWSAVYKKRGQLIVYVIPVGTRGYVEHCIDVATNEDWLSCEWNPQVRCCGHRSSIRERVGLIEFWRGRHSNLPYLLDLGMRANYTPEASMECVIKYTYLKTHRLAGCKFDLDLLDEEGNTFLYLLKTHILIYSLEDSDGRGMVKYKKAFIEREHELALHLVQFTEVIEKACLTFLLHPVCIYLWDLCKKFTSYYHEVMVFLDSETFKLKFFLCDATKVVMKKCFDLLGITPESSRHPTSFSHLGVTLDSYRVRDARPDNVNPRFEMFCMNVIVDDSFNVGKMHGIVSLVDADGLLSDERLPLNRNEHGHVAYFYREWFDAIGIRNNGLEYFGSPSPCCIAPFSSALEIYVSLFVTTADKCFQMCNCQETIDLSEICVDNIDYKRGTLRFEGKNGRILIDYIALRDAVDATMKLSLELPEEDPVLKASGCIFAYYGDMLDGLEGLTKSRYKAIIFKAAEDDSKLADGPLTLKKSLVAVPVNGSLVLEAKFFDESGKVLFRGKKIYSLKEGSSEWRMPLKEKCILNLTVEWSQGPKSSYV